MGHRQRRQKNLWELYSCLSGECGWTLWRRDWYIKVWITCAKPPCFSCSLLYHPSPHFLLYPHAILILFWILGSGSFTCCLNNYFVILILQNTFDFFRITNTLSLLSGHYSILLSLAYLEILKIYNCALKECFETQSLPCSLQKGPFWV